MSFEFCRGLDIDRTLIKAYQSPQIDRILSGPWVRSNFVGAGWMMVILPGPSEWSDFFGVFSILSNFVGVLWSIEFCRDVVVDGIAFGALRLI